MKRFLDKSVDYPNLKYVCINVGVNDTDENSGVSVFNSLKETIENVRARFNAKVIVSEITPRKRNRKSEVSSCNRLLNEYVKEKDYLFIARHENLQELLYDEKHVKETCIARYAANIKNALRKAYNRPFNTRSTVSKNGMLRNQR